MGFLFLLALVAPAFGDFLYAAGNWTRKTNMFSEQHFVPGYNEAGHWDIITGGNWSETAHVDLRLLGDAAAHICPCPNPPCAADEGPPKPGFNTSAYACLPPDRSNATYVICSVFHEQRTNVTCVGPEYAVACDIPKYDPSVPVSAIDANDLLPSRSFYNDDVTAVSCIARGMAEQVRAAACSPRHGAARTAYVRTGPHDQRRREPIRALARAHARTMRQRIDHVGNFTDARMVHAALSNERCSVVCEEVCKTVCMHEHMSVHQLFDQLNA